GVKGKIYTDNKGRLLKQEFLGFQLIREEPKNIFKKNISTLPLDLIERFSIPSVIIPNKEELNYFKVRIIGLEKKFITHSANQMVLEDGKTLEIHKKLPKRIISLPIEENNFKDYLEEDNFIKFKGTQIEIIAKEIVGKENNAFNIVKLFLEWLDKNIEKVPTFSLPNPLDVLKLRRGDCGELSALLVGFLRSVGIPSYVNIGVVYYEGRFFYHAWVSAFVGEWIDVDPALNQVIADPTHIVLFKGLDGQFELFKIIDKLQIEVLEYR
ncbi:MAG: transglutaminase-like domain-containing protein, partial [Candidatus Omnitrophica bacterium]|nr:transglutaminase-like domain-containing protein [Candidatus Omnitrophota bacterium]